MYRFGFYPIAFFAFVSITDSALAASQPIEDAPLAGELETSCRFNADNSTDCVTTYSYTILKTSGREAVSRIDFDYSETDTLTVEKAELIQPGQKPAPLAKSQIDTRTAPNPAEGFLRQRQTSLAFPNLRVGSRIRYTVREHRAAKPSSNQFHYVLSRGASDARLDRFRAEFSAERPMIWREENTSAYHIVHSADKKNLLVELRSTPSYLNFVNEASNSSLRRYARLEIGSSADAQDHFGLLARRYNEVLSKPLPARAAAAVTAVKNKPPAQRVAALMEHINLNYRYLGDWRASERGYVPFSLSQIERNGYGDCKDLATLLVAMLKAVGVKAEPTLVSRGDFAPKLLIPGVLAPNHAIVRAEIDGAVWWLDPTNPVYAPGRIMPDLQERWALVMDANDNVREDWIPLEAPHKTSTVFRAERYTAAGKANVESQVQLAGMPLMTLTFLDRVKGRTSADQELCRESANESSDCTIAREETGFLIPENYGLTMRLTDRRALQRFGEKFLYTRPETAELWNGFANYRNDGSVLDIYMGAPETTSLNVVLSGGRFDAAGRSCEIRSPWFDVDMQSEPADGSYRYRYKVARKVSWLTHDEITSDAFGKLIEQARDCAANLDMVVDLPNSKT